MYTVLIVSIGLIFQMTREKSVQMTSYGCVNYVGDEDCRKCMIHGILLTGCPYGCKDYEDMYGNKEE